MRHELAMPEVTFELIGTMYIYFYFSQHLQYMYIFAKNFYSGKKKGAKFARPSPPTARCFTARPRDRSGGEGLAARLGFLMLQDCANWRSTGRLSELKLIVKSQKNH